MEWFVNIRYFIRGRNIRIEKSFSSMSNLFQAYDSINYYYDD